MRRVSLWVLFLLGIVLWIGLFGVKQAFSLQLQQLGTPPTTRTHELCYGIESARQSAIAQMGLSLLQDSWASSDKMKNYVNQQLRWVISHEVGHTLGLRHNFRGSTLLEPQELNNTKVTQSKGLVNSVMDYLPINLAPRGTQQGDYFPAFVGAYDEWAIEYGYKESHAVVPQAERQFLEEIAKRSANPETGGLRRRWASKPLNTFTEALKAFRTAMSLRFIEWLNYNRDVFVADKAALGFVWA